MQTVSRLFKDFLVLRVIRRGEEGGSRARKGVQRVQTWYKERHIVCSSEFPLVDDPYTHTHSHTHTTPFGPALSHIPELTLPFMASWLTGPAPVWHIHTVKHMQTRQMGLNQPLRVSHHTDRKVCGGQWLPGRLFVAAKEGNWCVCVVASIKYQIVTNAHQFSQRWCQKNASNESVVRLDLGRKQSLTLLVKGNGGRSIKY